jgi:hypothetical protein
MDPSLWGALKKACAEFNREIHKLKSERGMNIIITCHNKVQTDDQGKVIGNGPDLQGDFAKSITKAVDILGYAIVVEHKDAKEGEGQFEHLVLTRPYTTHTGAGDRWAAEGVGVDATTGRPGVAEPNIGRWIEVLREAAPDAIDGEPTSPKATPESSDTKSTDTPSSQTETEVSESSPSEKPETSAPTPSEGEPTDPEGADNGDEGPTAGDFHDMIKNTVVMTKEIGKGDLAGEMQKMLRKEIDAWAEEHERAGKLKLSDVDDIPWLKLQTEKLAELENSAPF